MAGRPRKPIDLTVMEGRSHRSKAEIEQRKKEELRVDMKDVKPPGHLSVKQKKEFAELAAKLVTLNIMTELDEETLARYIIAKDMYLNYTGRLNNAIKNGDVILMEKYSAMQDRVFKQVRAGATDLGLTVSARCRLVVPKIEAPKENKFNRFGK